MEKTGGAREEKAKAKAGLGPRVSKGVWTWPEIKVSGYRWDTTHPNKAGGGHLVAPNPKQEEKKPPSWGAHDGQGQPLWVWKT